MSLALASSAGATTPDCRFLGRSPVFLDRDAEARCQMDEDGNGLDDEMEQQLAECFVPTFRFDADEPLSGDNQSLFPGEPVVGFSAYRTADTTPNEVRIRFKLVALYERDGGFVDDDAVHCSANGHDGDSSGFTLDVRVFKDQVWRAELVDFDHWPAVLEGTHPLVYPSAGKHHIYYAAGVSESDVWDPATSCTDPHRGNGPSRNPSGLFHVPAVRSTTAGGTAWANICVYARAKQKVPALRLQPISLGNLGFPGQTLFSFYDVTSPAELLHLGSVLTLDADGDQRIDVDFVTPEDIVVSPATDLCPLDSGPETDADGDHLVGACDPDQNFRQTWVGIGTLAKPAVPQSFTSWNPVPTHAFGGFLDTDQDGSPDGVEACPRLSTKLIPGGGATITNRWGEDENWPPHPVANNELGALQRDEQCDPYPVALSKWNAKSGTQKQCGGMGWTLVGQDAIGVTSRVSRGVSANDPFWQAPTKELPEKLPGQTHRCACRSTALGKPLYGASCVLDPNSDCYRATAQRASSQMGVGRGWRAVDRAACSRDPQSWCDDLSFTVPRFESTPEGVSWRWRDELAAFGPASATPHFAPEDVLSVPATLLSGAYQQLTHSYATWTLPKITAPPATPGVQTAFSAHDDPEYDPQHRGDALWNVQDLPSTRLRASFSEQPVGGLTSKHSAFSLAPPCAVLSIDEQLLKVKLWFGPDPVKPELTGFDQARVLLHDGGLLSRAALARPSEGGYAALTLGAAAWRGWLATEAVLVAPLSGFTQSAPAQLAFASALGAGRSTEPVLLAVERTSAVARWALLAPLAIEDASVTYEIMAEGLLSGAVGPTTEIVGDSSGTTLALVDFAGGWFEWLSFGSRLWARSNLPAELVGRSGAAVALWGAHLLVAGGERDGVLASDLWDIGLFGGPVSALRTDLPARRDAQLGVTPGGESMILVGGSDANGTRHDDVWQLAPSPSAARQVFADTTRAAEFDASRAAVFDAPYEGVLRALAFDAARPELIVPRLRTPRGWEEAVAPDEPRACEATDLAGGRLCVLAPEWWSNPGAVPCSSSSSLCEGSRGSLEKLLMLAGGEPAVAVDTDGDSVWVLRDRRIEHWSVGVSPPRLVAQATLPAKGRLLVLGGGGAAIGTDAGIVMARQLGGALQLDSPLGVCGRPLRMERLGETSWAVMTTVGLAIVGSAAGKPLALRSMSVLVPMATSLVALDTDPGSIALCKKADEHLPSSMVDALAKLTAVASVDGRVLVGSGPILFDIDAADLEHPLQRGRVILGHPLETLRVDPIGQRAYGVSDKGQHRPIMDLRGAELALTGQHALQSWVRRRDAASVRLRIDAGQAEVARVVP